MTSFANIVVPIKGLRDGKSRLSGVLNNEERTRLNQRLAERTLNIARTLEDRVTVYALSEDPLVGDIAGRLSVRFLHQSIPGLNAGLSEAASGLPDLRTVYIAADLPTLQEADIRALIDVPNIAFAPDRREIGTNAMSVPSPRSLRFQFGQNSLQAHLTAARNQGDKVDLIKRSGLAFDLDTETDLEVIEGWP